MWQLQYSYDGVEIDDLFSLTDGVSWGKERNAVRSISFSVSLRKLYEWCLAQEFDIQQVFTPLKSSVKVVHPDGQAVVGGWLAATPSFVFGSSADTRVQFTFMDWLGLTAGAFLIPPLSYNDNFDVVAAEQITLVVERTAVAGAIWPLSVGTSDSLAVVTDTLDAPKTLKDFLLERADNQTGTGTFDVYVDPDGVISLHEKYGVDLTVGDNPVVFSYPDMGGKYDLKEITFPEWDNYVSDMFLTGAGNGYASTSGAEGAAIFAETQNYQTILNTGYWQHASSESDITLQATLDDKATSYVRDTDKPFVTPSLVLDGDRFKTYSHDLGGNLWLGDTITVDTGAWVKPLLPLETPIELRINSIDGAVDKLGHCNLSLGMVSDE